MTQTLCILWSEKHWTDSLRTLLLCGLRREREISSVMRAEWKTVRSKASFHARIYASQDSLQRPKAKHSVFSSPPPATKHREQPCGLGHSQTINLVAKSLMYWCWWTSKSVCCSLSHPPSFSPAQQRNMTNRTFLISQSFLRDGEQTEALRLFSWETDRTILTFVCCGHRNSIQWNWDLLWSYIYLKMQIHCLKLDRKHLDHKLK